MSVIHTCSAAIEKLKKGNKEHVREANRKPYEIGVTEEGQTPYAAILGCADSRVIPECIFTAKAGELFTVRVAGNIANTSSIASLEYAVKYLHVRAIVVLGHESCGAVGSAINQAENRVNFESNLNDLLAHIVPAINDPSATSVKDGVVRNAENSAKELITKSEILRGYYEKKELGIFTGYYNIYGDNPGKVGNIENWVCPTAE